MTPEQKYMIITFHELKRKVQPKRVLSLNASAADKEIRDLQETVGWLINFIEKHAEVVLANESSR